MLRDMTDVGGFREVTRLSHVRDFQRLYHRVPEEQRIEMENHINGLLIECALFPDRRWGSILNTSIEGGKVSPDTGVRGDWTGTPYAPLWEACGHDHELAAMVFGNLWKLMIIRRPERWIGIRNDPTFPTRGITLMGKTYFVERDDD
jgi:hypothetical protein